MTWQQRLYQEILISLFLGCVPLLVAYGCGGGELLIEVVKGVLPPTPIFWYLAFLSVPYLICAFTSRYFWKGTDALKARSAFWLSTWSEIGTVLHGVWRAIVGALFTVPILWLWDQPETFDTKKALYFIAIGAAALLECWYFSKWRSALGGNREAPKVGNPISLSTHFRHPKL
ncbi:hypothetical protein GCM10017655_11290 [Pseudomonas turukhanskensis]|uniref:Lipoprotein n=1 Tax=Pseudomonas turukhanskensis TaxID=1806536 RepID=A0A9W6K3G1_9PSED|nr:hypothetical protein GCM10017655_11290 [Pseudomonas turukhanskensis]